MLPASLDLNLSLLLFTVPALACIQLATEAVALPVGKWIALRCHGNKWVIKNEEKLIKYAEYCFKLAYHTIVTTWGYFYLSKQPWFHDTRQAWIDWPQPMSEPFKAYYLTQMTYALEQQLWQYWKSFQFGGKFGIRFRSDVRGDFREMAVHHFVESMLLLFSWSYSAHRFGSLVLLVHDMSEIPVELCKLANFLKLKLCTAISFVTMLVSWAVLRLYIFPCYILRSIVMGEADVVTETGMRAREYFLWCSLCMLLLFLLLALHAFWFCIFLKMAYFLVVQDERHDLTEHRDGEKSYNERSYRDKEGKPINLSDAEAAQLQKEISEEAKKEK